MALFLVWTVMSLAGCGTAATSPRPSASSAGVAPTGTLASPTSPPTIPVLPGSVPTIDSSVLIGAGDICEKGGSAALMTAALIEANPDATVFTAGDNSNDAGGIGPYTECYGATWGPFLGRTHPAMGNHDVYERAGLSYWQYFGASDGSPNQGWYSYDMAGKWHVIVLNSNCDTVGGCGAGSPEEKWLRADLAAHPKTHIIAIWHHPLFSSAGNWNGIITPPAGLNVWWNDLMAAKAEIVINGHAHVYERFAPQDSSGKGSASGVREFVVGTGGAELSSFWKPFPNSLIRDAVDFGVLRLILDSKWYAWQFIKVDGTILDSGEVATKS